MAPCASDPKDLMLVLNSARRKALTILVVKIIAQMCNGIAQSFKESSSQQIAPLFPQATSARDGSRVPGSPEQERDRRLEARVEQSITSPKLAALENSALIYFDRWAKEVRLAMRKYCEGPEDPRSEQRRREWNAARNPPPPPYTSESSDPKNLQAITEAEARDIAEAKAISDLHLLYGPVPTRLTTISKEDRICVVSCMVLLLLSLGHYSAHSRVLLCYLTSSFDLPMEILVKEETEVAKTLMQASKGLSADSETQKRQAENASARRWKVGLASVAGAAVIGITGGLAAPVVAGAIGGIMGGVGLGGVASFLGIFAMNGALVGTLFGAFGGKMTGEMVDAYAKEVSDFKFLPVAEQGGESRTREETESEGRRLRVTVGINGWLNSEEDVTKPWRVLGPATEVFALRYEMDALIELGESLKTMVSSYAWSFVKVEILKRTVLATLWSALWPVYLLKMATSIDNPFAVARNRSEKAGEVLADALINKAQGERPVTLIGYSLGARVIHSCLRSLAERKAFGLVESVILIGAPIPSRTPNWRVMRSVVSGKFINVYSENDYILAFLYRATSIQFGVAGLQKIADVEGVENLDLSKEVSGHLRYPELIGKILKRCGVEGVKVEDADIEGDVQEVSLLDFEDDDTKGQENAKSLTNADILSMLDSEPTPPNPPIPSSSSNRSRSEPLLRHETLTRESTRPPFASASASTSTGAGTSTVAGAGIGVSTGTGLATRTAHSQSITEGMSNLQVRHPPDDDSDDNGGIQMIDNDSDGELQELECLPEPDGDEEPQSSSSRSNVNLIDQVPESSSRNNAKLIDQQEPKSLGSFIPKDKPTRVKASDMGLY